MRAEHNSGPENGPHDDSQVPLSLQLRLWAKTHNWHEPDYITNRLKLRRAFKKPIAKATAEFMTSGRVTLALQIKTEFAHLQETTRSLDRLCVKRVDEDDELVVLEHFKGQLKRMILDLAKLLEEDTDDGTATATHTPQTGPQADGEHASLPPADDGQWVTVTAAASMLGVSKSTVSKWVKKGRLSHNGQQGRNKRVSRISVLLVKQDREDEELKNDVNELRYDAKRYG